jgi:hypothetical protein
MERERNRERERTLRGREMGKTGKKERVRWEKEMERGKVG